MLLFSLLVALCCIARSFALDAPNIVYVLFDDIGWSDFGRNVADSPIPTPFIDNLTAQGVHLTQHYVHSVCSPTRAALLTGRFHVNTGMTNVLIPGTPAGLPNDIPTLPSLLSCLGGYSTAMAGKWHLGHAQHKMTPIGRGFEQFTGMYMWDLDSYTKQMYELPWEAPLLIDWVTEERHYTTPEHPAGGNHSQCQDRPYSYTYKHYAEPAHATEAITTAAETYMQQHAARNAKVEEDEQKPMFLYVAYTAAHSPLQPMPRHVAHCQHLKHERRRDYCGLIVGLDEALRNLTESIKQNLGENTILVVASDNGGSAYFGGMNTPLRGHKGTPFEGGVRVPAFVVDYTPDQKYLGPVATLAPESATESAAEVSDEELLAAPAHTAAEWARKKQAASVSYSRVFPGMMHVSDWLPTLLTYAQIPAQSFPARLDGLDFSHALRSADYEEAKTLSAICSGVHGEAERLLKQRSVSPRNGVLLEMYFANESVFNQTLVAYRLGDYKLIQGSIRDTNYYYESSTNRINSSHPSIGSTIIETLVGLQDYLFGKGESDTINIMMVHMWMHDLITITDRFWPLPAPALHHIKSAQVDRLTPQLKLYNIVEDPCELYNLAADPAHAATIAEIQKKMDEIAEHRPPMLPLDLQIDISHGNAWSKSRVGGDCSSNPNIRDGQCFFTHSWVADDANPMDQEGLMNTNVYIQHRAKQIIMQVVRAILGVVSVVAVGNVIYKRL